MTQHGVSRELAQKMKDAGFPQDKSLFVWRDEGVLGWKIRFRDEIPPLYFTFEENKKDWLAAPIATEIASRELLDQWQVINPNETFTVLNEIFGKLFVGYADFVNCEKLGNWWLELRERKVV